MKVQGKFKMQTHLHRGVVMDIAAFKVSHAAGSDIDATTLQAEKARSASTGAMDEMSQKVQNASTRLSTPRSRTRLS
jgi:translation elongation factor EF-Ts